MNSSRPSSSDRRSEKPFIEDQPAKSYNLIVIGIDILFEAAVDGSQEALKRLECIAAQVIQAAGDKKL
jgi:hypothetical protein